MHLAEATGHPIGTKACARALELTSQLREAVVDGDERRIKRSLSELLRVRGLTKGQRVALQMRALHGLVQSLRCAAVNDEVTGLPNRRGFMQTATRLLDLAIRDGRDAYLLYLRVGSVPDAGAPPSALLRQIGNFLRDGFPGYGVYDVLGRLGEYDFAALTTDAALAARTEVTLRIRRRELSAEMPPLPVEVGVAHFSSRRPVSIDELLQSAVHSLDAGEPERARLSADVARIASSGYAPQPGVTLC